MWSFSRWSGEPARRSFLIALAVALSVGLYLGWSGLRGAIGFPLDDAWIHQTYARNLVEYGQWAFLPGRPSAGSTSPLWTLLLAVGYGLGLPFRLWTYGLGGLCLVGTALLSARLAGRLFPNHPSIPLLAGLAAALEWHLVWAAVSGMETLLFVWLALALWDRVIAGPSRRPFLTGLLGGALVLTRPEGAVAVGLAAVGAAWAEATDGRWRQGLTAAGWMAAGAGVVVAPYLALNFHLSGTLWPNTFYAKQAEYAALLAQPLTVRLWRVGTAPLVGAQALLLPGLIRGMARAARRGLRGSAAAWWLPLIWAAATAAIYALRLPVTYQHGRYLIPVVPVILTYGTGGTLALLARIGRWGRTHGAPLLRAWALSIAVLFLAFLLLGARAYATDVAIIEGEMVAVARWINEHTGPDALIAVHDIGAVGYFARRPLLDLAGLVNPEVVPFIRDEARLMAWLEAQGADYLVTFPSWYPTLTADPRLEEVYRTGAAVTVEQGGENMAVYAIRWGR